MTLMAFRIFDRQKCQINVLEVGLGGRLDSTNVIDPIASVIVSVGKDHQKQLGDSLASITREKAGIVRKGKPLFLGSLENLMEDGEAYQVLTKIVQDLRVPFFCRDRQFGRDGMDVFVDIPEVPYFGGRLPSMLELAPQFIKDNYSLAMAIYHWYGHAIDGFKEMKPLEILMEEFPSVDAPWPYCLMGRFNKVFVQRADGRKQPMILDVCHNVDGVKEFQKGLLTQWEPLGLKKLPGMVSILKDKEVNPILDILKGFLDPIVLFRIDSERTIHHEDLEDRHQDLSLYDSLPEAWDSIQKMGIDDKIPLVVCGSVLAMGEVIEYFSVFPETLNAQATLVGDWDMDTLSNQ